MMRIKELETSIEYDSHKFDWHVPASDISSIEGSITWPQAQMSFADSGTIVDGVARLSYTDWSFSQVCNRFGIPAGYLKTCPHWLQDDNINYWMHVEENQEREFLVRGYDTKLRGFLSERYIPISNSVVLQATSDVIDTDLKYHCYVGPDHIYLKLLAMDVPDGLYGMGVVIINGEIGNYALRIAPFIQRHSCSNSIVFLEGGFYMRHVSQYTLAYIRATIKEKVGVSLGRCGEYLDRLVAAEIEEIPNISNVIDNICAMRGYNSATKYRIIVGTEGRSTHAAVVNGLSYAAHDADIDLAMDLESAAGYYLLGGIPEREQTD